MRTTLLSAIAFAFVLGCGSSDRGLPGEVGGGGSAQGGVTQAGGVSGGGSSAGSSTAAGIGGTGGTSGATSGVSGSPGNSSGGTAGRGGGSAGRGGQASSSGGTAQNAGTGGGGAPGAGGSAGCVQNLGCKLQSPASSGDLHQDCVDRINQFRTQCACLPPLARNLDGEACADQMAEYDAGKNTAHAGHTDKVCQPSGAQNECPGYSSNNQVISLCMQQMWDEGPPPTNPCEGDCFQEHGHFINMTSKSSTKVACGFYTTASGKVWAVQNFMR
jgi:hypothetical protein